VIAITANYCEADQTADRRLGVPKNPSRRQFPRGSLPPTGQRPLLFTPLDMDRASCREPKYRRFLPAPGVAQHPPWAAPNNFRQPQSLRQKSKGCRARASAPPKSALRHSQIL